MISDFLIQYALHTDDVWGGEKRVIPRMYFEVEVHPNQPLSSVPPIFFFGQKLSMIYRRIKKAKKCSSNSFASPTPIDFGDPTLNFSKHPFNFSYFRNNKKNSTECVILLLFVLFSHKLVWIDSPPPPLHQN